MKQLTQTRDALRSILQLESKEVRASWGGWVLSEPLYLGDREMGAERHPWRSRAGGRALWEEEIHRRMLLGRRMAMGMEQKGCLEEGIHGRISTGKGGVHR